MDTVYFVESLPYFKPLRAMMRHTDSCFQCAQVLDPEHGSGEREDLCAVGQALDAVTSDQVDLTRDRSEWN